MIGKFILGFVVTYIIIKVFRDVIWACAEVQNERFENPTLAPGLHTVTAIIDGDTVDLTTPDGTRRVRLYGIDAPELDQPLGEEASEHLRRVIMSKDVRTIEFGKDKYGRDLVMILLKESKLNVNLSMVKHGYAEPYYQYLSAEYLGPFTAAHALAKRNRYGIWGLDDYVSPHEHRRCKQS